MRGDADVSSSRLCILLNDSWLHTLTSGLHSTFQAPAIVCLLTLHINGDGAEEKILRLNDSLHPVYTGALGSGEKWPLSITIYYYLLTVCQHLEEGI